MSKLGALSRHHTVLGARLDHLTQHQIERATMNLEGNLAPNEPEVTATLSTPCRAGIELTAMSENGAIAVAGQEGKHNQTLVLFAPGSREYKIIAEGSRFKQLFFPTGSDQPAYEVLQRDKKGKIQNFVQWKNYKARVTTFPKEEIKDLRFWEHEDSTYCLVAVHNQKTLQQRVKVYSCQPDGKWSRIRSYGSTAPYYHATCLGIYAGHEFIKLSLISHREDPCQLIYRDWNDGVWSHDHLEEHLITEGVEGRPHLIARRPGGPSTLICPPDSKSLRNYHGVIDVVAPGDGGQIYTRKTMESGTLKSNSGARFVWPPSWNKVIGERWVFVFKDSLVMIAPSGEKDEATGKTRINCWVMITYKLDGQMTGSLAIDEHVRWFMDAELRQVDQMLVYRDSSDRLHFIDCDPLTMKREMSVKPNFPISTDELVACNDGSIRAVRALTEGSVAEIVVYRP
jgi:hypothetical protein